jgi:hypothetical protein
MEIQIRISKDVRRYSVFVQILVAGIKYSMTHSTGMRCRNDPLSSLTLDTPIKISRAMTDNRVLRRKTLAIFLFICEPE